MSELYLQPALDAMGVPPPPDVLNPNGKDGRNVKNGNGRTPCSEEEAIAVQALMHVSMPSASWDKRFRRTLSVEAGLTDKERPQVWRLFKRYRRQIHGQIVNGISLRGAPWKNLLDMADLLSAPDFRKVNAMANEQAKIDELRRKSQEAVV